MALCRYANDRGEAKYALYRPGQICPLDVLTSDSPSGDRFFARDQQWLASVPEPSESQWQSAPQTLLPPVPPPEKIICIGLN